VQESGGGSTFDFKRDRVSLSLASMMAPAGGFVIGGGEPAAWDELVDPRSTLAARHLEAADIEVGECPHWHHGAAGDVDHI
jgi:hypothetical protein